MPREENYTARQHPGKLNAKFGNATSISGTSSKIIRNDTFYEFDHTDSTIAQNLSQTKQMPPKKRKKKATNPFSIQYLNDSYIPPLPLGRNLVESLRNAIDSLKLAYCSQFALCKKPDTRVHM